ncbi:MULTISPECIES: hypothetical protein [unclassified Mesorhizobium]|uniref:hypothetical protein n=1 Tax=unclassified Mesorhizobium TaxID=325217 RepID=UPI0033354704
MVELDDHVDQQNLFVCGRREESSGGTAKHDDLGAAPLLLHQDHPLYAFADMPLNKLWNIGELFPRGQGTDGKEAKIVAGLDQSKAQSTARKAVRH